MSALAKLTDITGSFPAYALTTWAIPARHFRLRS